MPALGMHKAMDDGTFRIHADTDTGTYGIVQTAGQSLRSPPLGFAICGCVDIGIPAKGDGKGMP
ncbi:hypothetical protein D3C87_2161550 [compost metagenome]